MTKVLTNSSGPQHSGWLEVEMSDSELADYIETADETWFEKNRDIFADWEYEKLTKAFREQ